MIEKNIRLKHHQSVNLQQNSVLWLNHLREITAYCCSKQQLHKSKK